MGFNMSWESSEETAKAKAAGGKYFKLADDGDQARIVLLTEPQEQEKEGSSGSYTVYTVDIWNVDAGRVQTWDMGPSQFKSLLGIKRMLGIAKLYAHELIVLRNGKKGDTQVSYTWTADGKLTSDTVQAMAAVGISATGTAEQFETARKPVDVPFHDAPTVASLEGGIVLATSLPELRAAFEKAWADADGHDAVQSALQARYESCKAALSKPVAAQKRAPAF